MDPLLGVDLGLTIERSEIGILGHQNLGNHGLGRQSVNGIDGAGQVEIELDFIGLDAASSQSMSLTCPRPHINPSPRHI